MTSVVQEVKVNTPTLSIRNAHIGYTVDGEFTTAVKDVSFDVHPGETVMLLGPSGCGKSTLLKAVAGFNKLSDGELSVAGKVAPAPGPDRAVVFQEFDQLFAWRTVRENVAYPLRVNGRSKSVAREMAQKYLTMTGLSDALDKFPHQLSGGMKQRVSIARALALEPVMLLMDEPFASLDAQTRSKLQRDLKDIKAATNVTTLFVTHSLVEALILGDRIVVLTKAPSVVAEIIDPRQAQHDDVAQAALRDHIRNLLAGDRVDAFIDGTIE
jgi:NitT/TauT family transport system ATP-binding protein